jgi:hypothetical protein
MDNTRTIMPNGRYTDAELNLLKTVFAENLPLVKLIRKIMLQLPITEAEEVEWRRSLTGEDLSRLMSKMFLPQIDGDAPIGQVVDLWMTVNLENKLPEEAQELVDSRKMVIDYVAAQLDCLKNGGKSEIRLDEYNLSKPTELKARNTIIAHVENQIREINGLAGYVSETPEETIKRLSQNSNK